MKRKVLDMVVSSWNVSNEASEDGGGGGSEMRVCRVAVSVCLVLRRCRSLLTVCDDAGCWSKPGREGVSALFLRRRQRSSTPFLRSVDNLILKSVLDSPPRSQEAREETLWSPRISPSLRSLHVLASLRLLRRARL